MSDELRKYIRVEINSISNIRRQAISKQFEEDLRAKVLNISVGGIYIETTRPFPEGTLFDFEFRLPDSDQTVKARGMIIWVTKKRHVTCMGIKFIKVSTNDKQVILAYISQKLESKGLSLEDFTDSVIDYDSSALMGFSGLVSDDLHKHFLRIYFKEIGFDLTLEEIKNRMNCSAEELNIILKTYENNGLIKINKKTVDFFYAEESKLRSQIDNWIRENGA